jgi:NADPH-dependent curcumin reductase CurA
MKGDYLEAYNFITYNYQGIIGYIVYGDEDDDCYECSRRFTDLLVSKKITYKSKIINGLDHDYPDNFNEILPRAIEFILRN